MESLIQKTFLRDVLGKYMVELGKIDNKVVIVNADLMGTCRNKTFVETFPERSFNVGIAEQNMMSFAAGLAHEGFKVYTFSMAPFISMRACEQVRTDVAYGNANVRMIATYSGVSGGISGATHWSLEDCAIMTAMPNMVVMEPCDPIQARKMLLASLDHNGPIYIRSSVEAVSSIYKEDYSFEMGKASIVKSGNDGTYICSGITVNFALDAANRIKEEYNKDIRVIDMHTLKPIDKSIIIESIHTKNIVVAQDHNKIGGLGYAVAEILTEEKATVNYINLGINDEYVPMAHASFLYHKFGYDADGLYKAMISLIK